MSKNTFEVIRDYYYKQGLKTSLWVRIQYLIRVLVGRNSRDENLKNHFCIYFAPYNLKTKKVFMVYHKKSGLWLFPGGHIDRGETPTQALKREIWEELGVILDNWRDFLPFLLTITKIPKRKNTKCRKHFDIWYPVSTNGIYFNIDMTEFFETEWLSITEAKKIVIDESNIQALNKLEVYFK